MMATPDSYARDLLWAINSPALLEGTGLLAIPQPIGEDDFDRVRLREFIEQQSEARVGRYFERLIEFYLAEVLGVELIHVGRTIVRDGRTIGELDFVFRADGQLFHWETAVKFFLCCRVEGGISYLGPNPNDSLNRKAHRLFEHQLPMGRELGEVRSSALVRGRIFYHPLGEDAPRPRHLAAGHLRAAWINAGETEWLGEIVLQSMRPVVRCDNADEVRIVRIRKPHWLAEEQRAADDEHGLLPLEVAANWLQHQFRRAQKPQLIAILRREPEQRRWVEATRMFVVSNQWPGRCPRRR